MNKLRKYSTEIVNKNLEMLSETSTFETVDSYLPFFYEKSESLFDYLDGYTFVIDDLKRCEAENLKVSTMNLMKII